ncbi:MarR family transcriptional regulator [Azorhizobium oxalatiphilum]|uniref:MarR family transcriptional regulator n=1 Tax=Azorhizobium oxalatiphilum TaxID=980631 RepID=A0A917FEK8_9HYPH|nr:MarR family winged helix-turn-helix transcriptional regulator [Azorhizobium oxalatiphilum]GGF70363.1 MarR family transcriptional regulator [Azorhizobium oxalatiphilum]
MSSSCYCTLLRMATRKLAGTYDAALAPAGINVAQFSLLRTVQRRQPVSLTELGRLAELDRSTIGRNVRVLEKMDLVSLTRGKDQREAMVALSETGRETLDAAAPLWDACQTAVAERLGPQRSEALRDLLSAF